MAQQRSVVLVDDLDGGQADRTVILSLDGVYYELDLSTQNIQRLHDALAPYTANARVVHTAPNSDQRVQRPPTARTVHQPTPPATDTPPISAPPSENNTAAAQCPPVPAALFSDPSPRTDSPIPVGAKAGIAALFTPAD